MAVYIELRPCCVFQQYKAPNKTWLSTSEAVGAFRDLPSVPIDTVGSHEYFVGSQFSSE